MYIATCVDNWKLKKDSSLKPEQVLSALEEVRFCITEEIIRVKGLRRIGPK
jgi:hypothetical protein